MKTTAGTNVATAPMVPKSISAICVKSTPLSSPSLSTTANVGVFSGTTATFDALLGLVLPYTFRPKLQILVPAKKQ